MGRSTRCCLRATRIRTTHTSNDVQYYSSQYRLYTGLGSCEGAGATGRPCWTYLGRAPRHADRPCYIVLGKDGASGPAVLKPSDEGPVRRLFLQPSWKGRGNKADAGSLACSFAGEDSMSTWRIQYIFPLCLLFGWLSFQRATYVCMYAVAHSRTWQCHHMHSPCVYVDIPFIMIKGHSGIAAGRLRPIQPSKQQSYHRHYDTTGAAARSMCIYTTVSCSARN